MTRPRAVVLVLLVLLWSGAAAAQARTDQIAGLMAYIPATFLTPSPSLEVYFHDATAAQRAVARSPAAIHSAVYPSREPMAASTVRAETSAKPFPRVCPTGRAAETYVVGDSPAALVLAIERPIDELEVTPRNLAHHALMTGYLMRDLSFLGVQ